MYSLQPRAGFMTTAQLIHRNQNLDSAQNAYKDFITGLRG